MSPHASTDWDAQAYHRLSEPQVEWGKVVLSHLLLRGDETVLDAGCGTGRLTAELLARLPHGHVLAVDLSNSMLEQARAHLLPRHAGRVEFLQADLAQLSLEQVAHVVFSTATFHWVADHEALFASLFRALKPRGRLVAQCGGEGNLARVRGRGRQLMAQAPFATWFAGWSEPYHYADVARTHARLEAAGFSGVRVWSEPAPVHFDSAEEYRAFLKAVTFRAHLARLPTPQLKEAFLSALVVAAAGDSPPFTLDYVRLNLQAQRPG